MEREYILYTLGSRGTLSISGLDYAEFGGLTSCYILKVNKHALVIDCGTGLYNAKEILSDCERIDVAITHLHYDHILGLLKPDVFPSNVEINFYSAFDCWYGQNTFNEFLKKPFWPVKFDSNFVIHDLSEFNNNVELDDDIELKFVKSHHPDDTHIIFIKFNNYKIACMFDFEHSGSVDEYLDDLNRCDILIYDGMYEDADFYNHVNWGHSTYEEGCALANRVNAKRLIITHHDPNCKDDELRRREMKSQLLFKNTRFARCGDKFIII